jgi:hypothetical protein
MTSPGKVGRDIDNEIALWADVRHAVHIPPREPIDLTLQLAHGHRAKPLDPDGPHGAVAFTVGLAAHAPRRRGHALFAGCLQDPAGAARGAAR